MVRVADATAFGRGARAVDPASLLLAVALLRLVVVPCLNAHKRPVRDPLYSFNSLLTDELLVVPELCVILTPLDELLQEHRTPGPLRPCLPGDVPRPSPGEFVQRVPVEKRAGYLRVAAARARDDPHTGHTWILPQQTLRLVREEVDIGSDLGPKRATPAHLA